MKKDQKKKQAVMHFLEQVKHLSRVIISTTWGKPTTVLFLMRNPYYMWLLVVTKITELEKELNSKRTCSSRSLAHHLAALKLAS